MPQIPNNILTVLSKMVDIDDPIQVPVFMFEPQFTDTTTPWPLYGWGKTQSNGTLVPVTANMPEVMFNLFNRPGFTLPTDSWWNNLSANMKAYLDVSAPALDLQNLYSQSLYRSARNDFMDRVNRVFAIFSRLLPNVNPSLVAPYALVMHYQNNLIGTTLPAMANAAQWWLKINFSSGRFLSIQGWPVVAGGKDMHFTVVSNKHFFPLQECIVTPIFNLHPTHIDWLTSIANHCSDEFPADSISDDESSSSSSNSYIATLDQPGADGHNDSGEDNGS